MVLLIHKDSDTDNFKLRLLNNAARQSNITHKFSEDNIDVVETQMWPSQRTNLGDFRGRSSGLFHFREVSI